MNKVSCPKCGNKFECLTDVPSTNCTSCGTKIILSTEEREDLSVDMELGRVCLLQENFKDAYSHFSRAVKKNPSSGDAWFWRSIAVVLKGNFTEGDIYWKKSTFTAQETVSQLKEIVEALGVGKFLELSIWAAREGQLKWAEILTDSALNIDKARAFKHYTMLAELACGAKEFDKADCYLENAQKSLPQEFRSNSEKRDYNRDLADTYISLAEVTGKIGDLDKAASYLEHALQIEPSMANKIVGVMDGGFYFAGHLYNKGYLYLANIAAAKKQFDKAELFLERALQIHDAKQIHNVKEEIAGDRGISSHENCGYIELAHQAGIAREFDKAILYLERALEIYPRHKNDVVGDHDYLDHDLVRTKGYIGLAHIAGRAEQIDKAIACLERALEIDLDKNYRVAEGYLLLAENMLHQGRSNDTSDHQTVTSCLERAVEISPDIGGRVAFCYLDLAKIVGEKGMYDLTKNYLQRSIKLGDNVTRRNAKGIGKKFGIKLGWF